LAFIVSRDKSDELESEIRITLFKDRKFNGTPERFSGPWHELSHDASRQFGLPRRLPSDVLTWVERRQFVLRIKSVLLGNQHTPSEGL